jgi:hypothetical protein
MWLPGRTRNRTGKEAVWRRPVVVMSARQSRARLVGRGEGASCGSIRAEGKVVRSPEIGVEGASETDLDGDVATHGVGGHGPSVRWRPSGAA